MGGGDAAPETSHTPVIANYQQLNTTNRGRLSIILVAELVFTTHKGADMSAEVIKRKYRDWYNYETRKTTIWEAFWMTVFTAALCIGFPVGFAALFMYGVPFLAGLF